MRASRWPKASPGSEANPPELRGDRSSSSGGWIGSGTAAGCWSSRESRRPNASIRSAAIGASFASRRSSTSRDVAASPMKPIRIRIWVTTGLLRTIRKRISGPPGSRAMRYQLPGFCFLTVCTSICSLSQSSWIAPQVSSMVVRRAARSSPLTHAPVPARAAEIPADATMSGAAQPCIRQTIRRRGRRERERERMVVMRTSY